MKGIKIVASNEALLHQDFKQIIFQVNIHKEILIILA